MKFVSMTYKVSSSLLFLHYEFFARSICQLIWEGILAMSSIMQNDIFNQYNVTQVVVIVLILFF